MSITAQNVIDRVRDILADEDNTDYRWPDADLLRIVNDGVKTLFSRRPDSRYDSSGTWQTYADAGSVGATLLVNDKYIDMLVHYSAARAFEFNGGEQEDLNRSQIHWQTFERLVQTS